MAKEAIRRGARVSLCARDEAAVARAQALLEARTLGDRAELLVQLMQFQRIGLAGADIQPTLQ